MVEYWDTRATSEAVDNHGEMCILLKLDDTRYSSFLRNLKVVLRTLQTKIFVRVDLTDMLGGQMSLA